MSQELQKLGGALNLQSARKWGRQPYIHNKLNSANNLNEQKTDSPPESPESSTVLPTPGCLPCLDGKICVRLLTYKTIS